VTEKMKFGGSWDYLQLKEEKRPLVVISVFGLVKLLCHGCLAFSFGLLCAAWCDFELRLRWFLWLCFGCKRTWGFLLIRNRGLALSFKKKKDKKGLTTQNRTMASHQRICIWANEAKMP
jgi:hypothetical protein